MFMHNEMHNPTGLTPNNKIKTTLTPVGVDAGVIRFSFHVFVNILYVIAIAAIQNAMPIQRLTSEKITNRLGDSLV